jgi:hypothetical protein
MLMSANGTVVADPQAGCATAMTYAVFDSQNVAPIINLPYPGTYPASTFTYHVLETNNTNVTIDRCRKLAEVYKFLNFVIADLSTRERATVGGYVPATANVQALIEAALNNLTCDGQPLPLEFQIPIPAWVTAVILALAAFGILSCLIIYPILFIYRRNPHFIYGDLDFLLLILFGALLVFIGLVLFGSFPDNGGTTPALCMGTAWLIILGFAILYVSLILKILRIYYTVLPSKKLQQTKINLTFGLMFIVLCITLIPVIIVLAVWNGVQPLTTTRTQPSSIDEYYVVCYVEQFWWPIGFVIAGGVLMAIGAYVATRTRNLAPGFNESAPLALSIYNAIVVGGVVVLLVFVLNNTPVINIIFGIGLFLIAAVPVALIYPPKIWRAVRGQAFQLSKQIKGRCSRCFADCVHCTSSKVHASQGTVARSSARTSVSQADDAA